MIAWKRLAVSREFSPQEPGGSARVTLVMPIVGGLVAVGGVTDWSSAMPSVAVWTSRGSVAWRRAATDPSFENAVVLAATTTRDGIVIVGTQDHYRALVFKSTDGTTWKSVDQESFRDGVMRAVTEWGARAPLVAVGVIAPSDGTAKHAAVWLSDAKGNWRLAKSPPAVSALDEVVATQYGLLAFSSRPAAATPVWTSVDGDEWSKLGEVPGWVTTVARTPTTIIAAGEANGAAAVWVSSDDGISWTPSVVGQSKDAVIYGLARLGAVTIAVGSTDLAPLSTDVTTSNYQATSWTSLDNVTWTRAPTSVALARSTMIGVTATGTALVAVGETDQQEAALWTGELIEAASPGP